MTKQMLQKNPAALGEALEERLGKPLAEAEDKELYFALLGLVKEVIAEEPPIDGERRLYYFSAEFLIGKLLSNNLINLGLYDAARDALAQAGKDLAVIEELEPEPSLGNGGLGRLAACYLDSAATLGLPADGVGLLYHYGLFRQSFWDQRQQESPDPWLPEEGEEGAAQDTGRSFTVPFAFGEVTAKLYDLAVTGYDSGSNRLHLFELDSVDESLVRHGIRFDQREVGKNLTLFLYPDDSDRHGQILRVYQQYFMVSAGAQMILEDLAAKGYPLQDLHKHVVIQINDTHPSMVIPELIRLLTVRGVSLDEAIAIVRQTCAYTNHTILAEALEKWPLGFLQEAVPQLAPIIRELDRRVKEELGEKAEGLEIIDEQDRVHMAHMDIHYGFSVNGVAALHTEILKNQELSGFYAVYPEKFNNKTNGVTFRRWLMSCNPELSGFITQRIGEGWKKDASRLEELLKFGEDPESLEALLQIKQEKKSQLAAFAAAQLETQLDPASVFDIQAKRLHEYKRQQMNALYLIWKMKEIKAGRIPARPVTALFGAKAAPAYTIAKDIIHLLLLLSEIIAEDEELSPWLRVLFVPNYNVSWAEKLIPACDVSEQISLAGKEASGTGNMKFMLNGGITLGTMDGANAEICDLVGRENIAIFGRSADEVAQLYQEGEGRYSPRDYYPEDPLVEELMDFMVSLPVLRRGHPENLGRLFEDMTRKDWFMALLDLQDYIRVKEELLARYEDRQAWAKMMLVNIAKAGFFSSDRSVAQYNDDIWKLTTKN